jgi:hypothetical protein
MRNALSQGEREFLARMDAYRNEGPPPPEQRTTREQVRARFGVWRVYRWELDGPADREFADLDPAVRALLTVFMDAVVIVDPHAAQRLQASAECRVASRSHLASDLWS